MYLTIAHHQNVLVVRDRVRNAPVVLHVAAEARLSVAAQQTVVLIHAHRNVAPGGVDLARDLFAKMHCRNDIGAL